MKQYVFGLMSLLAAFALPHGAYAGDPLPITTASLAGNVAMAPIGWIGFCKKNPGDCEVPTSRARKIALSDDSWNLMVVTNASVNQTVEASSDMAHWGVNESWDYPTDGKGDCEDYALQKRKMLIKAGLPRQALLITVVLDRRGDGHAVLMARTDHGDFILDNQYREIMAWDKTGYTYLRRMSEESPNAWVAMKEGAADIQVAAR
jgi:predicted transglutaminase-like cysteine proteinase